MPLVAPRKSSGLDWDDLRVFLAIAQNKSLTRAARSLKVTQPTAGRRLALIEEKAGAPLFERTAAGLVVSELGRSILEDVERMESAASAVDRRLAGQDDRLDGLLRVTCLEWFGSHVLAPICARFSRLHPDVVVEIVTDSRRYSLGKREADLAFRSIRFEQLDVVQKKLGTIEFAVYAAPEYLALAGEPDFATGLAGHALVTFHEELAQLPDYRAFRAVAPKARFSIRSNSTDAMIRAAESGAGVVMLPRYVGDASRRLVSLPVPEPLPTRPIWLGVHKDLQHAPRVRAFIEFVSASIKRLSLGPSQP